MIHSPNKFSLEGLSEGDKFTQFLLLQAVDSFSTSNATVLIIAILILLLMTAVIAGSETAFFSLSAKDIFFLKTKEKGSARVAAQLLEQPKLLLATLLVANNFINIAIVITTNMLIESFLKNTALEGLVKFLIQVVCVTFLLVLFGEVLPKVYATQNNLRMALFASPYIKILSQIFRPISSVLVSSTKFIENRMNTKSANNISNEDFEHAIELTVGHSATKEEVNIFKGILKFGNITAKQIMRTRHDVSAIDEEMSFSEVRAYCLDAGYSRLPVYKETLDKVAGMIHTKDFLPYLDKEDMDWAFLIRPAYFVHEGKLIEDLLKEFQHKRIHFAMVVDEFGGTSGIVTLEDIMEEIIGDIKDEFDEDDLNYKKIDNHNYIFEGKTLINDVCRILGESSDTFDSVRGESDSLAGLILEIHGKFADVNDIIVYEQYAFTVLALDKMRIQRVKLTIREQVKENA